MSAPLPDLALLAAALRRIEHLETRVQRLEFLLPARNADSAADHAALIRAISRYAGSAAFTSGDLIDAASLQAGVDLRDALALVLPGRELNVRRLGRLLRRISGRDFTGLAITRTGTHRNNVQWRVIVL